MKIMVETRPASSEDAVALLHLVGSFPTPTPPSQEQFLATLRAKLPDPSSCLIVAVQGTELVGYVAGYCHAAFYAAGRVAWVDEILVTQTLRGLGTGRQLMSAFEEWARQRGCVLVSLATRGSPGFYERLGYTSRAAYFKKYLDTSGGAPPSAPKG
jgi:GNAT superfamily N-acetyltransferase